MKIKASLYNSTSDDLTIVIDLLRASTTIVIALSKFNKIIPVNNTEKAFELKKVTNAILAGESNAIKIEGFDLSNSPYNIKDYEGETLILKTTNGTRVLENTKNRNNNTKVLIGTAINANAVAKKALKLAENEIELVMAGVREEFRIEDCVGAGLIINEIIKIAKQENIDIELNDSALASKILSENPNKSQELISSSQSAKRLKSIGAQKDINMCKQINNSKIVPIYENGEIKKIN